jgi:protein TonB
VAIRVIVVARKSLYTLLSDGIHYFQRIANSTLPNLPRHSGAQQRRLAMHFSQLNRGGSKAGRLVVVAGVHVVLGGLLIHGIQSKTFKFPELPPAVVMIDPVTPRPVEPPPQPPSHADLPPLRIAVPVVEVPVAEPPPANAMRGSSEPDPAPAHAAVPGPSASAPADPPAPPARPAPMRTAAFADANACALPAYPPRAVRNGDTGTTILALLIGADGRVGSARVERSSGFRELDRAAIDALSLCRFKPATNNGAPEAGWAQLGYVWTLD